MSANDDNPTREVSIRRIDADLKLIRALLGFEAGVLDTADYLICAGSKLMPVAGWKHVSNSAIDRHGNLILSSVPVELWGEDAKQRHLADLEGGRKRA